ncbi:MAG TPA: hypothetical protein VFF73_17210 [Planctomycetota bacterium]|nr:hypothetical protein [Planctomycetota bacterium]
MIHLAVRNAAVVAALGLVALGSGCFEEKTTVTVHADGSGTVHLSRKFTEEFTKKNYEGKTDAEMQDLAAMSLYEGLRNCQGVVAWSTATGKVEGGKLIQDAVGYFEDVTKLKVTNVMNTAPKDAPFTWKKNPDGGFTLGWAIMDSDDDGSKTFDKKPTAEEDAQGKTMMEALKGFSMERILVMPGKVAKADRTFKERTTSATLTFDELTAYQKHVSDTWAKIEKKETTKEAATADAKERVKKLGLAMEVTCGPPDAGDAAAFAKELAKAKETYRGSELKKKIEAK